MVSVSADGDAVNSNMRMIYSRTQHTHILPILRFVHTAHKSLNTKQTTTRHTNGAARALTQSPVSACQPDCVCIGIYTVSNVCKHQVHRMFLLLVIASPARVAVSHTGTHIHILAYTVSVVATVHVIEWPVFLCTTKQHTHMPSQSQSQRKYGNACVQHAIISYILCCVHTRQFNQKYIYICITKLPCIRYIYTHTRPDTFTYTGQAASSSSSGGGSGNGSSNNTQRATLLTTRNADSQSFLPSARRSRVFGRTHHRQNARK